MTTMIREAPRPTQPPPEPGQRESWIARLALWSAHHRRIVFGMLALILVAAIATQVMVKADTNVAQTAPGDTGKAGKLLDGRFGSAGKAARGSSQELVVFSHPTLTVDDPAYRQTVQNLMQQLGALQTAESKTVDGKTVKSTVPVVAGITTQYDTGAPRSASPFVSQNKTGGDVTFALVKIEGDFNTLLTKVDPLITTVKAAQKTAPGFAIELGGEVTTAKESSDVTAKDLSRSLLLNLPITFFLLLLAFGSIVAGLVPLGLAVASIVTANALLALISRSTRSAPSTARWSC
ncbi:MAG: MMPL family transporter [Dehalococcoidia bacterium]